MVVRGGVFAPCVGLHGFIGRIGGSRGAFLKDVLLSRAPTTCLWNCTEALLRLYELPKHYEFVGLLFL